MPYIKRRTRSGAQVAPCADKNPDNKEMAEKKFREVTR
jgi:hypothetical protein